MNGPISKSDSGGLIGLIHAGDIGIPRPFERDIFLFDTFVAGTTYVDGILELEPHINVGVRLDFFREVDNSEDKKAIVIKNTDGIKIGYVPQKDNVIFSRLMDAGKLLFGKVSSKEVLGTWVRLGLKIYLRA